MRTYRIGIDVDSQSVSNSVSKYTVAVFCSLSKCTATVDMVYITFVYGSMSKYAAQKDLNEASG